MMFPSFTFNDVSFLYKAHEYEIRKNTGVSFFNKFQKTLSNMYNQTETIQDLFKFFKRKFQSVDTCKTGHFSSLLLVMFALSVVSKNCYLHKSSISFHFLLVDLRGKGEIA